MCRSEVNGVHQERQIVSIQRLVAVGGRVVYRSEVNGVHQERQIVSIQPLVAVGGRVVYRSEVNGVHQERQIVSIQPLVAVGGRVVCRSEVNGVHQERQIVSIQPLVTVTLCRWPCRVQVGSERGSLPTCTQQLPEVVLTQFFSPDDDHDVLETCRELEI